MKRVVAATLALLGCGAAQGAILQCRVPARLSAPRPEVASPGDAARTVPIGGYTLAMIWGPQHCNTPVPGATALKCNAVSGRGFTLHGLWPDGEGKEWPQWCASAPIVSQRVVRAHYCATPSAQLQQHEWAKHGTCLPGISADAYFDQSNTLFDALRFPAMGVLSRRRDITYAGFAAAFAKANRGIDPNMVRLNLDKQGWLQEIWLCLDKSFAPIACRGDAPADTPIRIRPMRS